jgi:hypothetical protein
MQEFILYEDIDPDALTKPFRQNGRSELTVREGVIAVLPRFNTTVYAERPDATG